MRTATGLDVLAADEFAALRGLRIGLLCNQASVDHHYRHILEHLVPLHRSGFLTLAAVFGPQHGLFGHTQDNMIEWEASDRVEYPIYSLYGETRKPTAQMLAGLDRLVVDIQDVGSRYYTFAWTMAHCIEACADLGIPVTILDRPNPIGGTRVEGPVLRDGFESFVGLYPVATRHGMTVGEIARFVGDRVENSSVSVVEVRGWNRDAYLDETDAPWAMPSPNMPTIDTAVVYPGGCLIEGTNLSEGRGTTRPFEIVGAPFLDGARFADALNKAGLGGVYFRPIQFEPTFNKHAGRLCEGVFVHVTDRSIFEPVLSYVALISEAIRQTGLHEITGQQIDERFVAYSAECELPGFAWKRPPYEYVYDRMPIDILAGNEWVRDSMQSLVPLGDVRDRLRRDADKFGDARKAFFLYK